MKVWRWVAVTSSSARSCRSQVYKSSGSIKGLWVGGARPFETGLHMLTEQPGGGARYLSERETHMV